MVYGANEEIYIACPVDMSTNVLFASVGVSTTSLSLHNLKPGKSGHGLAGHDVGVLAV